MHKSHGILTSKLKRGRGDKWKHCGWYGEVLECCTLSSSNSLAESLFTNSLPPSVCIWAGMPNLQNQLSVCKLTTSKKMVALTVVCGLTGLSKVAQKIVGPRQTTKTTFSRRFVCPIPSLKSPEDDEDGEDGPNRGRRRSGRRSSLSCVTKPTLVFFSHFCCFFSLWRKKCVKLPNCRKSSSSPSGSCAYMW